MKAGRGRQPLRKNQKIDKKTGTWKEDKVGPTALKKKPSSNEEKHLGRRRVWRGKGGGRLETKEGERGGLFP